MAKVLEEHRKRGRPGNQEEDHTPLGLLLCNVQCSDSAVLCTMMQCSGSAVASLHCTALFSAMMLERDSRLQNL